MLINLEDSTVHVIVVTHLVTCMNEIERSIIDLENRCKDDYEKKRVGCEERLVELIELRELFCTYEKVLKDHGYSYDYAAEHFNIPTIRRDEKFTCN